MSSSDSSLSPSPQRPLLHPSQLSTPRKKCYSLPKGAPRKPDWSSILVMTALFATALFAAVAQHFFYTYLNRREIDSFFLSQVLVSRVTTAIVFLFKTCIVAAVGIAYMQAFWHRVRRSAIRVKGLDSMFSVLRNPFEFFNPDILFRAKILLVLAMVSWTLPIASIFVPGALTVTSQLHTSVRPVSVPVLGPLDSDVGFVSVGADAILLGATEQLRRIATRVLTGGEIINWPSPCGSNCSYSVSFLGPAFDCQNITDLSSAPGVIQNGVEGSFVLAAWGSVDDYTTPPASNAPPLSLSSQGLWLSMGLLCPNITVQCKLHNATYKTNVTFLNNLPMFMTEVILHNQIPSSVIENYNETVSYGGLSGTANSTTLWQSLNLFAIEDSIASLLSGWVSETDSVYGGFGFIKTLIAMSDLVQFSPTNITFTGDLAQQLEELLVNTTLSLNFFLQRPPIPQISGEKSISSPVLYTSANATIVTYIPQYSYSFTTLWFPYSTALLVGLLCILLGTIMLFENGVNSDMSFSQLLVTTRNSTFDAVADGACLGGGAISDEMRQVKLRYGQLQTGLQDEDDSEEIVAHAAFGLNNEIVSLRRGRMYA